MISHTSLVRHVEKRDNNHMYGSGAGGKRRNVVLRSFDSAS